jgi:hypothetical protein
LNARKNAGEPVDETYDKVVSSAGIFTFRFKGDSNEIPDLSRIIDDTDLNQNNQPDMQESFELFQMGYGAEAGLLLFLQDQGIPHVDKLVLYRTDRVTMEKTNNRKGC